MFFDDSSMDQEGANYLSQEAGFGVPIILSAENLEDAFSDPAENTESKGLMNESEDVGESLHNDLNENETVFEVSSNHDMVPMENGLENVIENHEEQTEEEDSNVSQTQNLKVNKMLENLNFSLKKNTSMDIEDARWK